MVQKVGTRGGALEQLGDESKVMGGHGKGGGARRLGPLASAVDIEAMLMGAPDMPLNKGG